MMHRRAKMHCKLTTYDDEAKTWLVFMGVIYYADIEAYYSHPLNPAFTVIKTNSGNGYIIPQPFDHVHIMLNSFDTGEPQ